MRYFLTINLIGMIAILCGISQAFSADPNKYFMGGAASSVISTKLHIGLLLPLQSPIYGKAAHGVKEGFIAAAKHQQTLPLDIKIYATSDDPLDILSNYQQALDDGASIVVGPLSRNGVSTLVSSGIVAVPTLALNVPSIDFVSPPNLFLFGLRIENEASQIAELAMMKNKHHAIIITDDSPMSVRLQVAFAEKWLAEYGNTAESVKYEDGQVILKKFRKYTDGKNNIVFLALNTTKSRWIRAYLSPETPVYGTSQLFSGNDNALYNHDVNGVQFMDMPWLLQPDHPTVMAYRETVRSKSANMERLYALGIDAFYLAASMLQVQFPYEISFDGVTGRVRFMPPNQFVRKSLFAQFDKGKVILLDIKVEDAIDEQ